MKNRIAPLLGVVAAFVLAACESSSPPGAPSRLSAASVPAPAAATEMGTTFVRQPVEGPIVIHRGELDFGHTDGEIWLEGSRGFSLTASVTRSGGIVRAIETCFNSDCTSGTAIPLGAFWSGNDLHAIVTLDGRTYTNVGDLAGGSPGALVEFSGSVLAPPLTKRGTDQVSAAFSMEGRFSSPEGIVPFSGTGVVKLWLTHTPGSTGWGVERLLYKFKHQP